MLIKASGLMGNILPPCLWTLCAVAAARGADSSGRARIAFLAAAALGAQAMPMTMSRSGLLGLLFILALMIFFRPRTHAMAVLCASRPAPPAWP